MGGLRNSSFRVFYKGFREERLGERSENYGFYVRIEGRRLDKPLAREGE